MTPESKPNENIITKILSILSIQYHHLVLFGLFICAILFIIGSYWITNFVRTGENSFLMDFGILLLQHLATAIFIFIFSILILELIFRLETLKEIGHVVESTLDDHLKKLLDKQTQMEGKLIENQSQMKQKLIVLADDVTRLRQIKNSGIVGIFSGRSDAYDPINDTISQLTAKLKKENPDEIIVVRLLGITLHSFTANYGKQAKSMNDLIAECKNNKNNKIIFYIIFQYPFSNSAVVRMFREDCYKKKMSTEKCVFQTLTSITSKMLYNQALTSLKKFHEWKGCLKDVDGIEFHVKICTFNPMLHILEFGNKLYLEPYHLGLDNSKSRSPTHSFGDVLMMQIDKEGPSFDIVNSHFDFIWKHESTIDLEKMIISGTDDDVEFIEPDKLDKGIKDTIFYNISIYSDYLSKIKVILPENVHSDDFSKGSK